MTPWLYRLLWDAWRWTHGGPAAHDEPDDRFAPASIPSDVPGATAESRRPYSRRERNYLRHLDRNLNDWIRQ